MRKKKSLSTQRPVRQGRVVKKNGRLGKTATQSGVRPGRATSRRK